MSLSDEQIQRVRADKSIEAAVRRLNSGIAIALSNPSSPAPSLQMGLGQRDHGMADVQADICRLRR